MIKTIIGLILLLFPFLFIYRFNDKKTGFAYILSLLIAFHLILPIILQAFGIFNYTLVLGLNVILAVLVAGKVNFKTLAENIKKINIKKTDWIFIFLIVLLFFYLYSVHYNYTGKVTTINGYSEVENMKYPYPYFSDEWSAVAFIKYSIETGKLPLTNPYWYNEFFPNLEFPFHSFLSELILLLDLNPLTHYTILILSTGMLICLLVYLILRKNNITRLPSSIASLSVLYIVNSGNLPGIWNLIPIILGIISMLLCLLFMSVRNNKMVMLTIFLALIFYPPLFILHTASLILYLLYFPKKEKIKYLTLYLLISLGAAVFVSIFVYLKMDISINSFLFSYIKEQIIYQSTVGRGIPDFSIWKVIPIPILLFSVIGILKVAKNKEKWHIIAPVIIGLIYWLAYSKTIQMFFIGYARVVVFSSILLVLLSGVGIQYFTDFLNRFNYIKKNRIAEIIMVITLLLFLVLAFSYTQRDNWHELKIYSIDTGRFAYPGSPATLFLNQDDLKLFQDINEKNFLAFPWKGTSIGTATSNYPLDTKDATLTNRVFEYDKFMKLSCAEKSKIAREKGINYIYSKEFNCKNFEIRGFSGEQIYLYEFVG